MSSHRFVRGSSRAAWTRVRAPQCKTAGKHNGMSVFIHTKAGAASPVSAAPLFDQPLQKDEETGIEALC